MFVFSRFPYSSARINSSLSSATSESRSVEVSSAISRQSSLRFRTGFCHRHVTHVRRSGSFCEREIDYERKNDSGENETWFTVAGLLQTGSVNKRRESGRNLFDAIQSQGLCLFSGRSLTLPTSKMTGYPCGEDASVRCRDCGFHLCDARRKLSGLWRRCFLHYVPSVPQQGAASEETARVPVWQRRKSA